jgi:ribosomal 50S subunit-associated protein YjgA (DUF615 family)
MTDRDIQTIREALEAAGNDERALAALVSLVSERDRLLRVEEAARRVLNESTGRRSATPLLAAVAALRVALREA